MVAHTLDVVRPKFYDVNGELRVIGNCSIDQIDRLRDLYYEFWCQISVVDPSLECSFFDAIESNPKVLTVAKAILKLCKIKSKWVDLKLLAALAHSYTVNEEHHQGYLIQAHLIRVPKGDPKGSESGEPVSWDEYKDQIFTALVTTMNGDFLAAKEAYDRIPQAQIEGYFSTKAKIIEKQKDDPDGKKAEFEAARKKFTPQLEAIQKKLQGNEPLAASILRTDKDLVQNYG
jgi:hypothetical protein